MDKKIFKMTIDKFKSELIRIHGEPTSIDNLTAYLDFIKCCSITIDETDEYCEYHHILPRAQFKEYEKSSWNIVCLKYSDHIRAHELLYIAYPTRAHHRCLNFMRSQLAKDHTLLSLATKKGWQTLKNNPQKYEKWLNSQARKEWLNSAENKHRYAKSGWRTAELHAKRCLINKQNWTPELKAWKSKSMSQYFKDNPEEIAERNQKRWDNMSAEKRQAFTEKMTVINKSKEKREKAGASIKKRWDDPTFRDKMSNRRTFLLSFTFISPTGEIYHRDGIHSIVNEFNFSAYLINKFKNTNQPVDTKSTAISSLNTKGWTFIQHNENWHTKNK